MTERCGHLHAMTYTATAAWCDRCGARWRIDHTGRWERVAWGRP